MDEGSPVSEVMSPTPTHKDGTIERIDEKWPEIEKLKKVIEGIKNMIVPLNNY